MSPSKTKVRISIDGSCLNNGTSESSGGYAAVIELEGAVGELRAIGELRSTLCPSCDANKFTNNRAELRAAELALNFLHELAKSGRHKDCGLSQRGQRGRQRQIENYLSDSRSINAHDIVATVRTDSTFVLRGLQGINRVNAHRELWQTTHNCRKCMTNAGMDLKFEHVRGHSGDWANGRADEIAKQMAYMGLVDGDGCTAGGWCETCDEEFERLPDLATHFKEVHFERDLEEETIVDAFENGERTGRFECPWCDRVLASRFAFIQHIRDKHDYD